MNHHTLRYFLVALLLCVGCPLTAAAEEEAGDDKNDKTAVGTRTAKLLDLQREGSKAGKLLTIPGAEAGPSYQRYMDSFARPIPDKLLSEGASGAKK